MRENFFFNKSERELSRGNGKVEVCGSANMTWRYLESLKIFSQLQLVVYIIDSPQHFSVSQFFHSSSFSSWRVTSSNQVKFHYFPIIYTKPQINSL